MRAAFVSHDFFSMYDVKVLATLCVCLTSVSYGACRALTSAMIFAFQKDRDEEMKMSLEEASWLRKNNLLLKIGNMGP